MGTRRFKFSDSKPATGAWASEASDFSDDIVKGPVVGQSEQSGKLTDIVNLFSDTDGVVRIKMGLEDSISLGNLDSMRDWGYAPDYVEGMWMMLQQDKPDDYVLATNHSYSIRDFLDLAFNEVGISDWEPYVKQDPRFYRPAEVDVLCGDYSKAQEVLGWEPKVSLEQMVKIMILHDKERLGCE